MSNNRNQTYESHGVILVLGATGKTGRRVLERLKEQGISIGERNTLRDYGLVERVNSAGFINWRPRTSPATFSSVP